MQKQKFLTRKCIFWQNVLDHFSKAENNRKRILEHGMEIKFLQNVASFLSALLFLRFIFKCRNLNSNKAIFISII